MALCALLVAACNSSAGSTTTSSSRAKAATTTTTTIDLNKAYGVQRTTVTFVDKTRKTDDPNKIRSAPTRTLVTDIYLPNRSGPFPLIVFAHGANGHPRKFTQLLHAWARHGFVIAAPAFPLSNDRSGGPVAVGDYPNQALDMRFVLEQVLTMSNAKNNALSGKVDPEHVGVSGLSLGGATTYGVAFNACCRDEHIDAAIILSGIKVPFGNTPFDFSGTPILIMHGTNDPSIPYKTAPDAYAGASAPKYFVSLLGAGHAPPYENDPDPHDNVVIKVTTDFWNAYLRGDDTSTTKLVKDATVPMLSSVQYAR
jgi:predicted dienelactone hydrolase